MKKIILVTINLLLIGLIIFVVFYFLDEKTQNGELTLSKNDSLLSQFTSTNSNNNQIIRVSDSIVTTYNPTLNGKEVLYVSKEGELIRSDLIGKEIISETKIFDGNILSGIWSSKEPSLILNTIKNGKIHKFYYNYLDNKLISLHQNIQNVDFSPRGNRIVYSFYDSNNYEGNISISNPDGSYFINLLKTRMPDITVFWPKEETVYFQKTPASESVIDLFSLDIESKKVERILKRKENLQTSWAPNGEHIVFSEIFNETPKLYYKNLGKDDEIELDLETTADQCVWSNDNVNVFCYKHNQFYKINTVDFSKESIYKFKAPNEISDLKITPNGSHLLFFNEENGYLYNLILR